MRDQAAVLSDLERLSRKAYDSSSVAYDNLAEAARYAQSQLKDARLYARITKAADDALTAAYNTDTVPSLNPASTPGALFQAIQDLGSYESNYASLNSLLKTELPPEVRPLLEKALESANQVPFDELNRVGNELVRQAKPTPPETVTNKTNPSAAKSSKAAASDQEQASPPAENWGVKFTIPDKEEPYFLSLLPAMASQLPMQGAKDVPGSMPGLSFKVVPSVAKLKVPGFQPVFQHLGMDTLLVTMVGCFTGADGAQLLTDAQSKSKGITSTALGAATLFDSYGVPGKSGEEGLREIASKLDSYRNFQEFYQFAVLQGRELQVEINLAKNSPIKVDQKTGDKPLRSANGNPRFKALVKSIPDKLRRRSKSQARFWEG